MICTGWCGCLLADGDFFVLLDSAFVAALRTAALGVLAGGTAGRTAASAGLCGTGTFTAAAAAASAAAAAATTF